MSNHKTYAKICKLAFKDKSEEKIKDLGSFDEVIFIENKRTSTELYVAISEERKELIVAFRATKDFYDWFFTNMKTEFIESQIGKCHKGFFKSFSSIQDKLSRVLEKHKDKKTVLTGHSLGGAIALIAASYIQFDQCVTFGSPRVFDSKAVRLYSDLYGHKTYRYTMAGDFIVRVPWPFTGYRHVGNNHLYISRSKGILLNPRKSLVFNETFFDLIDEFISGKLFEFEDHAISLYISNID